MTDEFMTYDDLMSEMDDRDDSNDPEFRDYDGYCEHGTYVGGCGIDWMCGWCEDGISAEEAREIETGRKTRKIREMAHHAEICLNILLQHTGMGGIEAADYIQDASINYVCNPRSRYGRH